MLDQAMRDAILKLHDEGHGARAISRSLRISRGAVGRVISSGNASPPRPPRKELAEEHRERILELHAACGGNLVRVHEELQKVGATLSYQALTAFCRRHGIGYELPPPAGHYTFGPGEEMQHDTSPHDVKLGGQVRRMQTAALVLCYSRMLFFQGYPAFTRFFCKLFLTAALKYFSGACSRCMTDNTHVVVLCGTGREMVVAPEMDAFAERYGFVFVAHEKGDANRSARVERPFHFIENNFLAGREFRDFDELNREAVAWCDRQNSAFKRHLHATPRDLFAAEQSKLRPLPIWIPEPYQLHHRMVSVDGYVRVHTQLYSVPYRLIGRQVEVRETKDKIEIYEGPRMVATHAAVRDRLPVRVTDPSHRPPRGEHAGLTALVAEEGRLRQALSGHVEYIVALKKVSKGRGTLALRRLLRMVDEYPREAVEKSVAAAKEYRLYDLERLEEMVLRNVAREFFRLGPGAEGTKT